MMCKCGSASLKAVHIGHLPQCTDKLQKKKAWYDACPLSLPTCLHYSKNVIGKKGYKLPEYDFGENNIMVSTPTPQRRLNGVLLLDKDCGMSSNTALQRARRLYSAAKAGHTGVLDPLATGLLPVCFGEATKFAQYLLDADKAYLATLRLGEATTTGDAEGEVVQRAEKTVTETDVTEALSAFHGNIEQMPPMYSALKHQAGLCMSMRVQD